MYAFDSKLLIEPKDLLVEILETCHYLFSPKSWMGLRKAYIYRKPNSTFEDLEQILSSLIIEMEHVISLLQPAQVSRYFDFNKKQRTYVCPDQPDKPNSTSVYCLICDQLIRVNCEDCESESCPGNVLRTDEYWMNLCLTCGEAKG